jgi:hypothetical protein
MSKAKTIGNVIGQVGGFRIRQIRIFVQRNKNIDL